MKFQIGQVQLEEVFGQSIINPNRTRKYLLPCLRSYGEEFTNKIDNVYKVAVGLGDMVITDHYYKAPERHIFILINTKIAPHHFIPFINFIRDKEYYEDDYAYGNLAKTNLHMVIIKFPKQFWNCFDSFKEGKYSQMFTSESINKLFHNNDVSKVLIKDHNYKIKFTAQLNHIFGTTVKPEEYEGELDLPPNEGEETFNI